MGRGGRRHSARFIDLTDRPVTVVMAVTAEQMEALFARIREVDAQLFYVKVPAEFGSLGRES